MANDIQLKRSSVSGRVPDAANVLVGEPVINLADKIIFTKDGAGNVITIGAGTTSNIAEGSNLYFTNARAIAAFTEGSGIDIAANGLITANVSGTGGGTTTTFSSSPPVSPNDGDVWIDSDTGLYFVYLNDGSSTQWVEFNGQTAVGGKASTSPYTSEYSLQGTTSNATETELFINGIASKRIPVSADSILTYTVEVACRRTDVVGDYGNWFIKGSVRNDAGNVTDVGSLYEVIVTRTDASMLVDVRADNSNNTLGVYVTGASGKTVAWKAAVTAIEV